MNPDDGDVTEGQTPKFRLRLLGFPALTTADSSHVTGLGPGKPLALLAYLSVRLEARREELVDLLWGEVGEANARNAFRQALHRLRTALGEQIVPMDRDRVELARNGGIECDRDAFVAAIEQGDIGAAIEAYRGDFLEGFEVGEPVFDTWVDAERTRLKSRFQSALRNGAEASLAAGRWLEALQYVQRLTALSPYDEDAALLESSVLAAAGRAPEALASLRRFSQGLRDQLDLAPSPRVRDMLARMEKADASREVASPSRPKETPFVGREAEIAQMMALVRGLAAEQGATLFVQGPAGIGKSRLVSEFLSRAKSTRPLLVLRGRDRPMGSALPYASIAEALRGALRAPGVSGAGRHLLSEAARILPELRDAFELPEAGPIDAEGGRLRFFEGIAALLDAVAYEQPVCLVLDDVHNASASTVDLIGYLAARMRSSPVLIVLIHRDELERSNALMRFPAAENSDPTRIESEVLRVEPLDAEATLQLVQGIVTTNAAEGQLDVERVAGAAGGNPMRAIELAWRALNGEMPSAHPIPLKDILWARLQKSSPSQRRVFFAAALIQRRCSLRLLASAAHLPELATFDAAQELERQGLMAQEIDSFVVAHDFTVGFVSEASGLAGRALLAGWAADALANEPSPPNAELANLYSIAGQQTPAFLYARRGIYDAAALGSPAEVHRMLALALALAPDPRARQQIEAMLTAFGAGKKLLDAPIREMDRPPASNPEPGIDPIVDGAVPKPESTRVPPRRVPFLTARLAALIIFGTIATAVAVALQQSGIETAGPRTLSDSLLLIERGRDRDSAVLVITGPLADAAKRSMGRIPRADVPAWARALALPWIRPSISSSGLVAVERMSGGAGTDVYLMTDRESEPVPVATGGGIDAVLGWAPDGGSILVRRSKVLPDGAFDADLWSFRIVRGRVVASVAIDTSSARSVEEASWSPDGSRIAWVALSGPALQRDVFISRADGSAITNITENPGEDYHIAWSSDGTLLAFTSERSGNPDLFAIEFEPGARRLWRLSESPADEDFATFSPDNRFVAYQSTAGGDAAVYVMPALGGTPTRVTPAGGQFSIAGWRGRAPTTFIERFRILGPSSADVGDSVVISLFGADREGVTRLPDSVSIGLVGDAAIDPVDQPSLRHRYVVRPRREGTVTVIASIPGWRDDTLRIQVGDVAARGLSDDFAGALANDRWMVLGSPRPATRAGSGLMPNGDIEWQSGVLSRATLSLTDSVDVSATLAAPFGGRPIAAALLTIGLVADRTDTIDVLAPRLTEFVSASWDGEASRFTYSVGPESKSDPVSALDAGQTHRVRIVVARDGTVSFYVDSRLRWTSSLRFLGTADDRRARLWLGGRATGKWGFIQDLAVRTR